MGEVAGGGGDELDEGVVAAGAVAAGAAGEVMEEVREGGEEDLKIWRRRRHERPETLVSSTLLYFRGTRWLPLVLCAHP